MLLNITDIKDKELVEKLLNDNGIKFNTYLNPFDAFVEHEIKECEMVYKDILGKHTVDKIAKEVGSYFANEEVDLISEIYKEKAQEYVNILDMKTKAVATLSNNISLEMKSYCHGMIDTAIVVYDKDVYYCQIDETDPEDSFINIGELRVSLNDFIRVKC